MRGAPNEVRRRRRPERASEAPRPPLGPCRPRSPRAEPNARRAATPLPRHSRPLHPRHGPASPHRTWTWTWPPTLTLTNSPSPSPPPVRAHTTKSARPNQEQLSKDAPQPPHAERIAGHETSHLLRELVHRKRLRQKAVGSRFLGVSAVGRRGPLAHDEDGDVAKALRSTDEFADLVARLARKAQIDENGVGLLGFEHVDGRFGVRPEDDVESGRLELPLDPLLQRGFRHDGQNQL